MYLSFFAETNLQQTRRQQTSRNQLPVGAASSQHDMQLIDTKIRVISVCKVCTLAKPLVTCTLITKTLRGICHKKVYPSRTHLRDLYFLLRCQLCTWEIFSRRLPRDSVGVNSINVHNSWIGSWNILFKTQEVTRLKRLTAAFWPQTKVYLAWKLF